MPEEPITKMEESSAAAHEWYESMVRAGFTEDQAIKIMVGILSRMVLGDD